MSVRRSGAPLALLLGALASGQALAQTAAPKASVVPPPGESEGRRVIQFANGYASYRPDADDTTGQGGVTVEASAARAAAANAPEQRPPESEAVPEVAPLPAAPVDACRDEEELLAQRLLELRGVRVEPKSALLAWSQLETPLSPYVALSMFGRPLPLVGGPFLTNVLSWDLRTRELTEALAECTSAGQ